MKTLLFILFLFLSSNSAFSQKTILWKVTDTLSHKESYIVGTYHQMGNSFVDSIPQILEYLKKSEIAIFESVDSRNKVQEVINNRQKSFEIENQLKKKDLDFLVEFSNNWSVDLYKLNPIEIRYKLMQEFQKTKCGTVKDSDKWNHFDNYLIHLAKNLKTPVLGLETDSMQINLINKEYDYPVWKKEKKQIHYWIEQLKTETPNKVNCAFANQYQSFQLDYELKLKCSNDVLLKERNENWLKILPEYLKSKNCFIAVGLFHLYKKCGLIIELRNLGFKVTPIEMPSISISKEKAKK